jgi:hypothetical protein
MLPMLTIVLSMSRLIWSHELLVTTMYGKGYLPTTSPYQKKNIMNRIIFGLYLILLKTEITVGENQENQ